MKHAHFLGASALCLATLLSDACQPVQVQETSSPQRGQSASMFSKLAAPVGIQLGLSSRLVVVTRDGAIAINPGTWEQTTTAAGHAGAARSPDGLREVFQRKSDDGSWDVYLGGVGSDNPQRLTKGLTNVADLSWSADGRFVTFFANKDGMRDGYRVRLDGVAGPSAPEKLDLPAGSFVASAFGGKLAYAVETRRDGKARECDVIVADGDDRRTLLSGAHVFDLAFDPQGTRLAVSVIGSLLVFDLSTNAKAEFRCDSWDSRLYAHAPNDLVWSPTSHNLACRCTFVGGRAAAPGEEMPVLFGDREAFVITASDGICRVVSRPAGVQSVYWVSGTLEGVPTDSASPIDAEIRPAPPAPRAPANAPK